MPTPQVQNDPIYSLPFTYIVGLQLAFVSTTSISVAAGQCRDSNDVIDMVVGGANIEGTVVAAPLVINSAVVGANGLDTGTIAASSLYYVYIIGDSRYYKPVAALISLSATAPLLPFGYDSLRLIGSVFTDGSAHFLPFYQGGTGNGRIFQYDTPISVLSGGTATSFANVSLAAAVPAVGLNSVILNAAFTPAAAGNTAFIKPAGATGTYLVMTGQVAATALDEQFSMVPLYVSSVPEIAYQLSAGALSIAVAGYTMAL